MTWKSLFLSFGQRTKGTLIATPRCRLPSGLIDPSSRPLLKKPQLRLPLEVTITGSLLLNISGTRRKMMKKLEISELTSNLLVASSVLLAVAPLLLGDQLLIVVTSGLREGTIVIDQFINYLTGLLS